MATPVMGGHAAERHQASKGKTGAIGLGAASLVFGVAAAVAVVIGKLWFIADADLAPAIAAVALGLVAAVLGYLTYRLHLPREKTRWAEWEADPGVKLGVILAWLGMCFGLLGGFAFGVWVILVHALG